MSPNALLKTIKQAYPELKELSKPNLKLVEKVIVYATQIAQFGELATQAKHDQLLKKSVPSGKLTPGLRLKAYRLRENLTQEQLANKTGIPQANISAIEKGSRALGIITAKKIAKVLKCDYRQLV